MSEDGPVYDPSPTREKALEALRQGIPFVVAHYDYTGSDFWGRRATTVTYTAPHESSAYGIEGIEREVNYDRREPDPLTRETVILIHGTFDAPDGMATKWFEPNSDFCAALDRELAANGSSARCWAHLADGHGRVFQWSGSNDVTERLLAGHQFREYYKALSQQGWKCHIVAHSHGGNVCLRGLYRELLLYTTPYRKNLTDCDLASPRARKEWDVWRERRGEIVCLGTPFVDMPQMQHVFIQTSRQEEAASNRRMIARSAFLLLALFVVTYIWPHLPLLESAAIKWGIALYLVISLLAGATIPVIHTLLPLYYQPFRGIGELEWLKRIQFRTHILCLNSAHDEAFVGLRAFSTPPDALGGGRWSFVKGVAASSLAAAGQWVRLARALTFNRRLAARILRGKSARLTLLRERIYQFRSATWAVIALAALSIVIGIHYDQSVLASALLLFVLLASGFVPAGIRSRWSLAWTRLTSAVISRNVAHDFAAPMAFSSARNAVLGLEEYAYDKSNVTIGIHPSWIDTELVKCEDIEELGPHLTDDILRRRATWADRALSQLGTADLQSSEARRMLERILKDRTLVHSIYYCNDMIIARVARFIASRA